jgi:hypothetical protein
MLLGMRRPPTVLLAAAVFALVPSTGAHAAVPTSAYANCTALNAVYAHGIGTASAADRVTGRSTPVTTFRRDTAGYRRALQHNRGLDRDKDGVACEKR